MAKKIVWNKRAVNNFNQIIAYLEEDWNRDVTSNFIIRTYQLLDLIAEYPEIGTIELVEKGIRGFVITKHNTLFYRVDNDRIILLSIFDNRQNPQKKVPLTLSQMTLIPLIKCLLY